MEAFIGVVLGGLVAILTTLSVDVVRSRRELKRRLDADALDAVQKFVEVGSRNIGVLYDEGRGRGRGDSAAIVASFDQAARAAMDEFRVAHTRARLLLPGMESALNRYKASLDSLKALADKGFQEGDAEWKETQTKLNDQLDAVLEDAAKRLAIKAGDRRWL